MYYKIILICSHWCKFIFHHFATGTNIATVKEKKHKCSKCDKSYIGKAGLARHHRLNPEHSDQPQEVEISPYDGATDDDISNLDDVENDENLSKGIFIFLCS